MRNWLQLIFAENWFHLTSLRLFSATFSLLRKLFYCPFGDASWLNTDGWRYMFASECIPALLFLMLLYTVPESPRWLMSRGKQEQAESILRKIMGNTLATQAVQEIKHSWIMAAKPVVVC